MKNILPSPLQYKNNTLYFAGIRLDTIARNKRTPFYLYSKKTLRHYYEYFSKSAAKNGIVSPLVCYALKANSNKDVLSTLKTMGSGADVVSVGELKKALKAGIDPQKIVFSGVAKTEDEIRFALKCGKKGIYSFNVESIEELDMINSIAKKLKTRARVAFRLNPRVNAKTHKHISTGNKTHKFGLLKEDILEAMDVAALWTNTNLVGLSIHIGSQLTELNATIKAIEELSKLALKLETPLEFLDVGGGLGIDYTAEERSKLASIDTYMKAVSDAFEKYYYSKTDHCPRIVFEPGRIIVGKMGVLVSRVVRTKISDSNHFTIIDAGMNDLIRPALYEAYHEVLPAQTSKQMIKTDIVGPICETSDCFGTGRKLPKLNAGDLVVIDNVGAYGQTMASTYNERQIATEYFI
ncbi:diaminopimelate decarboxylase [Bacteriovorax sp. PP10]|uniref:Diaminopimelate decarboxylase n=1 Tax=Bacteriovorax antarcticus TaxID=3088717 RepID=A0ABU5VY65_9BACT|nr:diaminopimelate decarboxylase [Bacteriovorax sp. PP10]MEA9358008.1 diaminopimelate decarboxylase [Bacteriovorax sp. PP10]